MHGNFSLVHKILLYYTLLNILVILQVENLTKSSLIFIQISKKNCLTYSFF